MLRKSLATLPPTLDQTYERILCAISEEDAEYAMRILQWLTFSMKPLSIDEVAEVVAVDAARDPAFNPDEVLEDPLEVLSICSSLITVTMSKRENLPSERIVALAHYSVQEYLTSDRIKQGSAKQYSMQEVECHAMITKGSIKYLIQLNHQSPKEIRESALSKYSANFWSSHLQKTGDKIRQVSLLALNLMDIDEPAYHTWILLCDQDTLFMNPAFAESPPTPLYSSARLGWSDITELLLIKGADVKAQDEGWSALHIASAKGFKKIVTLLLKQGADVNSQCEGYGTALQAASNNGHKQVVELLLQKGADINAQGEGYNNALQVALAGGHEQMATFLLKKGADVNVQGGKYGNALQAASYGSEKEMVEILLNKGADVNAQGGICGNALQLASYIGRKEIVEMLLKKGADVNAQGGYCGSALQAASIGGQEQVITLLLNKGADVNMQGGKYGNALQAALFQGISQLGTLLHNKRVNWINKIDWTQSGKYGDALQAAFAGSNEQRIRILLDENIDIDDSVSEIRDYKRTVKLLLDAGAERHTSVATEQPS